MSEIDFMRMGGLPNEASTLNQDTETSSLTSQLKIKEPAVQIPQTF